MCHEQTGFDIKRNHNGNKLTFVKLHQMTKIKNQIKWQLDNDRELNIGSILKKNVYVVV